MGSTAQDVVTMESSLWVRHAAAPLMPRPHRHDDLELNAVLSGRLEYLLGGERVVVEEGQIALFWAATPHRLIEQASDERSDV